eukprot:8792375-Pyramimonas_sp.AAC.1
MGGARSRFSPASVSGPCGCAAQIRARPCRLGDTFGVQISWPLQDCPAQLNVSGQTSRATHRGNSARLVGRRRCASRLAAAQ